jgi:hypothetical protein
MGTVHHRRARYCVSLLAVLICSGSARAATTAAITETPPIGVHSMLYLDTPYGGKLAMFGEAALLGASTIRLDIALSSVFASPDGPPDWTGVDQDMALAQRYHLRVLADLTATPWYMTDCPPGTPWEETYTCPPASPALWAQQAGEIAAHTRGVIDYFEIINEPDGAWAFLGTARQYAMILAGAHDAIRRANPAARIVLGGLMNCGATGMMWLDTVLNELGAGAAHAFDIANVHIRVPTPAGAARTVRDWLAYLRGRGFAGPLWVTETGYPADPAFQTTPGYQQGPISQAQWMTRAVTDMLGAGAGMVFTTERDSLTGRYASEGVLQSSDPLTADPQLTQRPSFTAIRDLIRRWRRSDSRQRVPG